MLDSVFSGDHCIFCNEIGNPLCEYCWTADRRAGAVVPFPGRAAGRLDRRRLHDAVRDWREPDRDAGGNAHLDVKHAMMGEITFVPWTSVDLPGLGSIPEATLIPGIVLLSVLIAIRRWQQASESPWRSCITCSWGWSR